MDKDFIQIDEILNSNKEATKKKNKKKFYKRKRNIISLLSVLLLIIFCIIFTKLNLIPNSYTLIIILALFVIDILGIILINTRFILLQIIGYIMLIIIIISNIFGIYFVHNTNQFLNSSFSNNYITNSNIYYIVASKNSGLNKENINGEILYYDDSEKMKKAITLLNEKYDIVLNHSDDIKAMFSSVKDGTNNFMFIESSSYSIVFDLESDLDEDDYVILDEIKVTTKVKNVVKKDSNSFNIYLSGTDFTNNTVDFNMIATINIDTNQILLTSIPRDYYIPVYGRTDGARDTLSYMGPYGIDVRIGSLENFFNTKLNYYLTFNNRSVVDVVDTLGGIEYCSDDSFSIDYVNLQGGKIGKKFNISKGCQTLNGIQTLSFVRVRKSFVGGDRARQRHIREVIVAMINKLKNPNTITNYADILNSFEGLYSTNIPRDVISEIAKTTIENKGNWEIIEQSVDGEDTMDYVHLTNLKAYVMIPNMQTVETAKDSIKEVLGN